MRTYTQYYCGYQNGMILRTGKVLNSIYNSDLYLNVVTSLTKNSQNIEVIKTVEHMIKNYVVNGVNPITCDQTPIPALTEYSLEYSESVVEEEDTVDDVSDVADSDYVDESESDNEESDNEDIDPDDMLDLSIDERNITFRRRRKLLENTYFDDISSIESCDDSDDESWCSSDE
jgi:hypothetical protein